MVLHPWSEELLTHCSVVGTSTLQASVGACLVLALALREISFPLGREPLGLSTSWPYCGRWSLHPPEPIACLRKKTV